MVKFSEEMKDFIRNHLAYVATADKAGIPNVVPKGNIAVLDDFTLVFADLYAHQTRKNIAKNPNIAVMVVNPAEYRGYQFKGKAVIIKKGNDYDALSRRAPEAGQLKHPDAKYAVKIKVNKVIDIGYGETADQELGG